MEQSESFLPGKEMPPPSPPRGEGISLQTTRIYQEFNNEKE